VNFSASVERRDSAGSSLLGPLACENPNRLPQSAVRPDVKTVRSFGQFNETVGLSVSFTGKLAGVSADSLSLGMFLATMKEFDIKTHASTIGGH